MEDLGKRRIIRRHNFEGVRIAYLLCSWKTIDSVFNRPHILFVVCFHFQQNMELCCDFNLILVI